MINPKQISEIVARTLRAMGQHESSVAKLIKGTFVIESNLENLYDHSNTYMSRRGLMFMEDSRIEETVNEYIRFKPYLRDGIKTATGIDLREEEIDNVKEILEVNIELMVVVLYAFYSSKYIVVPDDNLDSISSYYKTYYDTADRHSKDEFITKYRETFVN